MLGLDNAHQLTGMTDIFPMSGFKAHLGIPRSQAEGGSGHSYHSGSYDDCTNDLGHSDYRLPIMHEVLHANQHEQAHPYSQHPSAQHGNMANTTSNDICTGESEYHLPPPITPPPPKERFSYTRYQLEVLNGIYESVKYPNSIQKQLIAKRVGITRDQVKIWFQNRRRKDVVGVKTKLKSAPLEDMNKGSMVPGHILRGVLSELLKYAENPKPLAKKNKTMGTASQLMDSRRAKPYDKPTIRCQDKQDQSIHGVQINLATSNSERTDLIQREALSVHFRGTTANTLAEDHQRNHVGEFPAELPGGNTYSFNCRVPISTNSLGDKTEGQVPPEADLPMFTRTPDTSASEKAHTDTTSRIVSPNGSCSGALLCTNKRQDSSDMDEKEHLETTYKISKPDSIQSSSLIPSSEQLDMVAPPNAVAPGAPTEMENRDCDSPTLDGDSDDSQHIPTSTSLEHRGHVETRKTTSQDEVEPPPNVTAPKSGTIPDISRLKSLSTSSASSSTLSSSTTSSINISGPCHSIYAPIPSYALPQHSWIDRHMSRLPIMDAFQSNSSNLSQNTAHSAISVTEYMLSQRQPCPPQMKLSGPRGYGHLVPPGEYKTQNAHLMSAPMSPSTPLGSNGMYAVSSHNSFSEQSQYSRDRMLPLPLVADAPQLLSTMPPPPAYVGNPYSQVYQQYQAHHASHFYGDSFQPLLISSLNNPYYNKSSSDWQKLEH